MQCSSSRSSWGKAAFAALAMLAGFGPAANMAADPTPGAQRNTLLILDRQSVAAAEGVTFQLNQAKKHPENPVLVPGTPEEWDSLQVIWPGTVLHDYDDKLFRCWYAGMDAVQKNRPPHWVSGYAESRDGIHWTKPPLGQIEHGGEPTNRIRFNGAVVNSLVYKNPDSSDRERRFMGLFIGNTEGRMTKTLGSSPDGKVWKDEGIAWLPATTRRQDYLDISQILFQPDAASPEDRVLAYGQVAYGPGYSRKIGMLHGPDIHSLKTIGKDPEHSVVLDAEKPIDEQLHFASVRKFGDTFLMLFESDRFSKDHGDLRLAASKDGRHFRRIHPETPLVATGPRGMWDSNILVTSTDSMQIVGDEVWIYYFGTPLEFRNWPGEYAKTAELRGSFFYPSCLGLATLPRDRFAFAAGPGTLTTAAIPLQHGLWLNADGEVVTVVALDTSGATLAEGLVEKCESLYRPVRWIGQAPSGEFSVRITLAAGQRLYSLQY